MNIDDYESLPTTSVGVNMTAGAIAGVLEHVVMYPLDSVKVRETAWPLGNRRSSGMNITRPNLTINRNFVCAAAALA